MQVPEFIRQHSTIKDTHMWHFYLLVAAWASVYTAMNVAVVLFLQDALESLFFAGLALAIGSVFAICFDGVFTHFQKIFRPRSLFLSSIIGMILAVLLFLAAKQAVFVYLAAIIFRVSYDLCDITAISYVLKRSSIEEFGQNLSYKQLAQGIGLISGFLVSAVLLWTATFIGETATVIVEKTGELIDTKIDSGFLSALLFVKIFLLALLSVMWMGAYLLFDRETEVLNKAAVVAGLKEIQSVATDNLKQKAGFLKGKILRFHRKKASSEQPEINSEGHEKSGIRHVFAELGSAIHDLMLIGTARPLDFPLIWSIGIMCVFSYWDTFLGTFMPIFLTEVMREQSGWVKNLPGSIIMFVLIIPVLVLLPVTAKWGDRHGHQLLIITGLITTMLSTVAISIIEPKAFYFLISAGFGITFGYLFVMSAIRANTAGKMSAFFQKTKGTESKDDNESAGAMLLIDNVGNIIGALLGGALIELLGFRGLFLAFGVLLAIINGFTFWRYAKISGMEEKKQSPLMAMQQQETVLQDSSMQIR